MLIHLAYDSKCRAAELLALTWKDFTVSADGCGSVIIRRSKTHQDGLGRRAMLTPACTKRLIKWGTALWRAERRLGTSADTFEKSLIIRNISRHGHIVESLSAMSLNRILKDRAWRAGTVARYIEHTELNEILELRI